MFTIVLPCCSNCGIDHCRLFYTFWSEGAMSGSNSYCSLKYESWIYPISPSSSNRFYPVLSIIHIALFLYFLLDASFSLAFSHCLLKLVLSSNHEISSTYHLPSHTVLLIMIDMLTILLLYYLYNYSCPSANFDYSSQKSELDADYVPMPIVHIDQDSDSDATMVQVSFGDRLGALIDTVKCIL